MITALYLIAGIIHIFLTSVMIRQYLRSRSSYMIFPILVFAALIYDNLIVGLGAFIGEGETLKFLNAGRFYTHALFTSWIIVTAFGILKRIGIGWAQRKIAHALFCLLALAMFCLGVFMDIVRLELVVKQENGTLRYVNDGFHGPPIPAIVAIIVLTIVGIIVWVKRKSPWTFLGALLMFICAPLGLKFAIVGQFGEICFGGALISGENEAQKSV
jgi:hypothetical protein